jgi:hypothetical protein
MNINRMHSDSKKPGSSFLVALLLLPVMRSVIRNDGS